MLLVFLCTQGIISYSTFNFLLIFVLVFKGLFVFLFRPVGMFTGGKFMDRFLLLFRSLKNFLFFLSYSDLLECLQAENLWIGFYA